MENMPAERIAFVRGVCAPSKLFASRLCSSVRPRYARRVTRSCQATSVSKVGPNATAAEKVGNDGSSAQAAIDVRKLLEQRVKEAMGTAFGGEGADSDAMLTAATREDFGDYQCNAAMGLAKKVKQKPRDVASQIVQELAVADVCFGPEIAGPGFINLKLTEQFLSSQLEAMLRDEERVGIPKRSPCQKIVVDFSSPNVAKEMHVGHLRSTIIGESIARTLEFLGHSVVRLNHVGDWGTQFGMLVQYLKETAPDVIGREDVDIGDLVEFYKKAKVKFDEDGEFRTSARKEVTKLQSGDEQSIAAWKLLCAQSRREFERIYETLDITISERGESFYNPLLKDVVEDLKSKGLSVEDDGAQVVFLEGFLNREGKPQPLIVQKSDGGYMYSTTDLAAIRYRTAEDGAERVLYVTDIGQSAHFEQVFQVAEKADYIPENVSLEHVPFGLVLGEDGKKFKTRSGDTVKLKDLLNEAVVRAKADFKARLQAEGREESEEYVDHVSKTIGLSAVKYADLKSSRVSNYRFSYEKMLALQGNTAPYMLYAYARIQGINRKLGLNLEGKNVHLILEDASERSLAKQMARLPEVLVELERDLKPSVLCEYMFELSQKFNQFYERCSINNAPTEELKMSRFAIATLTARVLKLSLSLLGIEPLERL
mmetsp:Transcript_12311/g.37549  ORF Transcript_12311/g.37549 Transcript_12311/m.37549 type:complete len:654 (-) Transcript_12311:595-2556(-)